MNGYCIDQLINDQAGLFRPGWIVMPQCTDWVSELQVGEGRERPGALLARRTRTIRMCSPGQERVSARQGWAGENVARSKGQFRPLPLGEQIESRNAVSRVNGTSREIDCESNRRVRRVKKFRAVEDHQPPSLTKERASLKRLSLASFIAAQRHIVDAGD